MKSGRFALAILLAACTGNSFAPLPPAGVELNDVHSRLNATQVREVVQPAGVDELRAAVLRAARESLADQVS